MTRQGTSTQMLTPVSRMLIVVSLVTPIFAASGCRGRSGERESRANCALFEVTRVELNRLRTSIDHDLAELLRVSGGAKHRPPMNKNLVALEQRLDVEFGVYHSLVETIAVEQLSGILAPVTGSFPEQSSALRRALVTQPVPTTVLRLTPAEQRVYRQRVYSRIRTAELQYELRATVQCKALAAN